VSDATAAGGAGAGVRATVWVGARRAGRRLLDRLWSPRALALLGAAGLLTSFLRVLHDVVTVAGDPRAFLALVAAVLLAAGVLSRLVRTAVVVVAALLALAVGMAVYLVSLPNDPAVGALLASNLELLTGRSVLQIEQTRVWVLAVTPAPVFLTAYLALRRSYTWAAAVGGGTLVYFVLTSDAGQTTALLGVISAAALVGFGDLDRYRGAGGAVQAVTVVLALMVIAPLAVPAVPASGADPVSLTGGGDDRTVEASLLSADSQFEVLGDISLSPEVRFTVTSDAGTYWRVDSYDRYTGDGWVRSGEPAAYRDDIDPPSGETVRLRQEYELEAALDVMPAAWKPVEVGDSVADRTEVSREGGLSPTSTLEPGERYAVTSAVPRASPDRLADAGTDYPAEVRERYTQLPANTPDRVTERTERLTARADNPYETARVIETWLEENREYSLDVDRPDGNVADAFLFEMERGYCTYYATTMATMLRTQGIPARVAVGYTPGEQVDADTWVVRGYDSHAWVEVYFPETGWVRFDPTPADPRQEAERQRLDQARTENETDVDTSLSEPTPTPTATPDGTDPDNGTNASTDPAGSTVTVEGNIDLQPGQTGEDGLELPGPPSREQAVLGAVVLAGAVAGLRRTGLSRRLSWWLRARVGGPDGEDPAAVVEHTFRRLEYRLEREHRPREAGETVRDYLDAVEADPRARRIATLRERVRYDAEAATPEMAAEATRLFDALDEEPP